MFQRIGASIFFSLRRRLFDAFHPYGACGLNALPPPPDPPPDNPQQRQLAINS
jgi:hypothetical protein